MMKQKIAGWGNVTSVKADCKNPESESEARAYHEALNRYISRGAGRSYGDSALSDQVLMSGNLDETIDFSEGVFVCQSGKLLADVLNEIVPKGYFLPVTPGTKYVSVGGAIAADVHGKNHHVHGCFSEYLNWFKLMTADGQIVTCTKADNAELFWATCGGMGLTGVILEASFRLNKIETTKVIGRTIKCDDVNATVQGLLEHENYTYSVAWVDCASSGHRFGRSLLYLGEHATEEEVSANNLEQFRLAPCRFGVPQGVPNWLLNKQTARVFNTLYFNKFKEPDSTSIVELDDYFYPLDKLKNWNRLYGSAGLVQYQVVIPMENAIDGMKELLNLVENSTDCPFLAVLKLFGAENRGWLSFPLRGLQIAFDFKKTESSLALMNLLDDVVLKYKGRAYLAKDARMKKSFFEAGYPKLWKFKQLLSRIDPSGKFGSRQSDRLGMT